MNPSPSPSAVNLGTPPPHSSGWTKTILTLVALLVIGGVVWLVQHRQAAANQPHGKTGGGLVPVIGGRVQQRDVPIYLDGIGTVTAYNTVTVHTRVSGELKKIEFTEGQDVQQGDLLALVDPAPYQAALEQAVAKKEQDAAQLANAQVDLKRYADLLPTDGVTDQTYRTQKALVAQLDATVKADQAAVDSAQVNLDYTSIRSPIDGRVGIRLVDQGNIVNPTDASGLVVLTQLKPIYITFTLPETVLSQLDLKAGAANYPVLAVARENTNVLATGQLSVIDNQIDPSTGTIKLKATFANDDLRLWPGEFVNTRLLVTTRTNALAVPASVVQRGPEGAFAFVLQPQDGSTNLAAAMQPITVGQIDNGVALIEDGLQPGQAVVVDGQYKLQDGSSVNVTWQQPDGADSSAAGGTPGAKKAHQHKKKPQATSAP
jgi:multidrug efflux system membrane fusion protein